jgi:hypothetical protein
MQTQTQKPIKVGMAVKFRENKRDLLGEFYLTAMGKTFKVKEIGNDVVYLYAPSCLHHRQEITDIHIIAFWNYFEIASEQLEFEF